MWRPICVLSKIISCHLHDQQAWVCWSVSNPSCYLICLILAQGPGRGHSSKSIVFSGPRLFRTSALSTQGIEYHLGEALSLLEEQERSYCNNNRAYEQSVSACSSWPALVQRKEKFHNIRYTYMLVTETILKITVQILSRQLMQQPGSESCSIGLATHPNCFPAEQNVRSWEAQVRKTSVWLGLPVKWVPPWPWDKRLLITWISVPVIAGTSKGSLKRDWSKYSEVENKNTNFVANENHTDYS